MKALRIPPAIWLLCFIGVTYNVAVSSLPTWLYVWAYVPANIAATVVLVRVARHRFGIAWGTFGITLPALVPGVLWGVGGVLIVGLLAVAVTLVAPHALSLPPAGPKPETVLDLVFQVFVRIPLGTVLPEEMLFRGVLLQLLSRYVPAVAATALSSLVFGIWHLGFAIRSVSASTDGFETMAGPLLAFMGLTVLFGVISAWMTMRSGTLLAPMTMHWLLNAASTTLLFSRP